MAHENRRDLIARHEKLVEEAQQLHKQRTAAGTWTSEDQRTFDELMRQAAEARHRVDELDEQHKKTVASGAYVELKQLDPWAQREERKMEQSEAQFPEVKEDREQEHDWLDHGAPALLRWREGGKGAREGAPKVGVWQALRARVTGPRSAAEERALSEAVSASGGILVGRLWSAEVVDALRQVSILPRLGARFISAGDDSKISFATVTQDPSFSYLAELSTGPTVDPQFGSKTLTWHTHRCLIKVSRELMSDASNLEDTLRRSISGAFATALDNAVFAGVGSTGNAPKGLLNYSSTEIDRIAFGTTAAGGARITDFSKFVDGYVRLAENNASVDRVGVAMSPRSYGQFVQVSSTGDGHLLGMPAPVGRFNVQVSNALPNTIAYGASTGDCSSIIMADWRDLAVGVRLEPEVQLLTERYAETYALGLLCSARYDHVPLRNASFVTLEGAST
jgi:HK97 family phage major capsid protein